MNNNSWFKKEKPMLTLPGLGGGSASNIYWRPGGGTSYTYVDDVFNIYLYKGNQSSKIINNGIKLGNANAGNSVDFDGSGDYLMQTCDAVLRNWWAQAFTIEYWIRADAFGRSANTGSNVVGVCKHTSTGETWSFGPIDTGEVIFYYWNGSIQRVYSGKTLSTGQWYHLAFVYDGGTGIKIFVDGTLEQSATVSGSPSGSSTTFAIGRVTNNSSGGSDFNGRISNLRITHQSLYTSNFTPSTEALTTESQSATASNVKLLCCNSSIITGATVTPNPIKTNDIPTASNGPFTASDGVGGLIWTKARDSTSYPEHGLIDTERGVGQELQSNSDAGHNFHAARINSFDNSGYAIGNSMRYNASGVDYTSWTWRKSPGFFDCIKFTGTGGTSSSPQSISHSLESIPGMIIIKNLTQASNWFVYHKSTGEDKFLLLNLTNGALGYNGGFSNITSSSFNVFDSNSTNTNEFIAYVFAGGESTAATAKCVEFDGNDALTSATSGDLSFGTGDYTVEFWFNADAINDSPLFENRVSGSSGDTTGFTLTAHGSTNGVRIWWSGQSRINGGGSSLFTNTWHHLAATRSSGTTYLFLDGKLLGTTTDSLNITTTEAHIAGGKYSGNTSLSHYFDGKISNLRIVKGTAVYTSSFKPPTEPLTNITNTVLLCCNGSTATSSTVNPGGITAVGNPTGEIDSPFDDPAGFVFGENEDQGIIKCGSFTVPSGGKKNIELGWEPQWWLWRKSSSSGGWGCYDAMRGVVTGGEDYYLELHNTNQENSTDVLTFNSTGVEINLSAHVGSEFVFMAVRRPDAFVGKPPTLGSDVYAESYGNYASGNNPIPNFTSGFPVDFAWAKSYGGSGDWWTSARLLHEKEIKINHEMAMQSGTNKVFDSNVGWHNNNGYDWYISHMWKRHAGFDVVGYKGNGASEHRIRHNLSKIPEMMWCKSKGSTGKWNVYHKGAGGGTNPATWYILFKSGLSNPPGQYSPIWNDTEPTETDFTVGNYTEVNNSSYEYIMMLFASVTGISDVGYYQGTGVGGNSKSINFGFKPRLLILKNVDSGYPWYLWDTTRGAQSLSLNDNNAQQGNSWVNFTDTGFTLDTTGQDANGSGTNYIYYAHS